MSRCPRTTLSGATAVSRISRAIGLAESLEHPATRDGKACWTDNGIRAVASEIIVLLTAVREEIATRASGTCRGSGWPSREADAT